MKKCSKCGEPKPLDGFSARKDSKDGLRGDCKICRAAVVKKYKVENIERIRGLNHLLYMANPDLVKARARKWKVDNRERARINNRKWAAENPELERESKRRWKAENPEAEVLSEQRRRARKQANGVFVVTVREAKRLLAQPCYLCLVAPSTTLDHVIPISRGGRHSIGNLLGACLFCNSSKNVKFIVEFKAWRLAA